MAENPLRRFMPNSYLISPNRIIGPSIGFETALASAPLIASLLCIAGDAKSVAAIKLLVLTMFACSCVIVMNRFRARLAISRPASTALVLAFIFWYAYPAVVTYFIPGYATDLAVFEYANEGLIIKSIALLALFLFSSVLIADLGMTRKKKERKSNIWEKRGLFAAGSLFWLSIGACVGSVLPYSLSGFSPSDIKNAIMESRAIDKPWLNMNNLGNVVSPFTFIASSMMIAGTAVLWLIAVDRKGKKTYRVASSIIAFFLSAVLFIDQGTRANIALIFSPALVVVIIRFWKRSRLAVVLYVVVVAFLGILLLQYVTLYRSSVTRELAKETLLINWYTLGNTIDYFAENVFAVSIVPSGHDYFKESNVLQFITSPIPRFIWPGKPISELIRFYTLARWNIDTVAGAGNTFPGIVGQYYMSWGWIGPILIGMIFGWLARKLDIYIVPALKTGDIYKAGIGILMITWMVLSYRHVAPAYLYPIIIYSLIIVMSRKIRPRDAITNYGLKKGIHWTGTN